MPQGSAADAPRRVALLVGAVVLFALALRLPTAGVQSFWLDEVYTGRIVDGSFGHAWTTIQRTENTPPLFYLLDWGWGRIFGTSEFALRSLSALFGALAVVPVVALARHVAGDGSPDAPPSGPVDGPPSVNGRAARFGTGLTDGLARGSSGAAVPVGVGLAAGVLLAVNPLAHWFSQEARSYALFGLLAGAAWLALLLAADRPTTRRLWLWAAAAVAVTWTHYFGGLLFVVGWAAIAGAVLARSSAGGRVRALRPLAVPGVVSVVLIAVLAPIASNQQSTDMYQAISLVKGLGTRIAETPKQFAVGYDAPSEYVLGGLLVVLLVVLVVAGAWPRDGRATRGTVLLGLVAAVWVLPLLAVVAGFDVVLTRNFVLLIPPLAVLAVLGAWRLGRRGWAAVVVVGVAQLVTIVVVAVTPVDQREDWRGLLHAAESGTATPEVLFIGAYQRPAATYYSPTLRDVGFGKTVTVRTFAIVDRLSNGKPLARVTPPDPPPGFTLVRAVQKDQWRAFVWSAPRPTLVPAALVQLLRTTPSRSVVLRP